MYLYCIFCYLRLICLTSLMHVCSLDSRDGLQPSAMSLLCLRKFPINLQAACVAHSDWTPDDLGLIKEILPMVDADGCNTKRWTIYNVLCRYNVNSLEEASPWRKVPIRFFCLRESMVGSISALQPSGHWESLLDWIQSSNGSQLIKNLVSGFIILVLKKWRSIISYCFFSLSTCMIFWMKELLFNVYLVRKGGLII